MKKSQLSRIAKSSIVLCALLLATGSTRSNNPFVALGFGNVTASGVIVRDIGDPDGTFEKVRELVDAQNN